jgi:hypothetical protein
MEKEKRSRMLIQRWLASVTTFNRRETFQGLTPPSGGFFWGGATLDGLKAS